MSQEIYDVIGTGPIGQTVADRARPAGLIVAAVERELAGGPGGGDRLALRTLKPRSTWWVPARRGGDGTRS